MGGFCLRAFLPRWGPRCGPGAGLKARVSGHGRRDPCCGARRHFPVEGKNEVQQLEKKVGNQVGKQVGNPKKA